jgi:oligoribonuclease NrnB/cAMP/cGMP phosphodiesterase (DHH superfamily)
MKNFDSIIYHYGCPDGVTGLWCAYKYSKKFNKIGIPAGKDPSGNYTDKNIIFIDVCPTYNFIIETCEVATKITILDHHKSAYDMYLSNKEELDSITNLEIIFDMNRSGCQIAWDYFFPDIKRPWFIDYVADQDLWTWTLINSKEINCAIEFNEFLDQNDLAKLDLLYNFTEGDILKLINEGKNIIKVKEKIMDDQLKNSEERSFNFNGIAYRIQTGTIPLEMRSAFGNLLANKKLDNNGDPDFGVVWNYSPKDNVWIISLRGNDTSPDLSLIATHFGGGGHAKACGFKIKENPFNKLITLG